MLVMAMKRQYIELKQLLEARLKVVTDETQKQDLEKRLERVNWAIEEMDRKNKEIQEVEI